MRDLTFLTRLLLLASTLGLALSCGDKPRPTFGFNPPAELPSYAQEPEIMSEALASEEAYERQRDAKIKWRPANADTIDRASHWQVPDGLTRNVSRYRSLPHPIPSKDQPISIGINIAGAEFGGRTGLHDKAYHYPTKTELQFYHSHGARLVRLPFGWERMQAELDAPLVASELALMSRVLTDAASLGMQVIIDNHNYGRYKGIALGAAGGPTPAQFAGFWRKLADATKGYPALLGYDLMNEPHDMPTATIWKESAQAAVNAVREVDKTHTIYIEGNAWSGAHSWQKYNARLIIEDPADNLVYQAHQYFDDNSSGTYDESYDGEAATPMVGVARLQPFVEWLKLHGFKGMIGETGVPSDDPRWIAVYKNFLDACIADGLDVTAWGGGTWWSESYPMYLAKPGKPVSAAFSLLKTYFPGPDVSAPVPPASIVNMTRLGGSVVVEGGSTGLKFVVANGRVGQSFTLTYDNEMAAADFAKSMAEIFADKEGIAFKPASDKSGRVTLTKDGDWSFAVDRPIAADNVAEPTDRASFAAGNQEQSDVKIAKLTGGLSTTTRLVSVWATDKDGTVAPPPP